MICKTIKLVAALGCVATLAACATAEVKPGSGFLSSYEGLEERTDVVRASVLQRRDEALVASIVRVWVAPAEIFGEVDHTLSEEERRMVLSEVDRQLCYELSERFEIAEQRDDHSAFVRIGVTRMQSTDQAGSVVAATANFFIPGPIKVRTPIGLGGLGAEAELLMPDGAQAAAIVWRRDAMVVGTDKPSLSRIGDAHQLAEPLGDMVAEAFSSEDRDGRESASNDPCKRFGPRIRPEGFITGIATGLYQPELSGGRPDRDPEM